MTRRAVLAHAARRCATATAIALGLAVWTASLDIDAQQPAERGATEPEPGGPPATAPRPRGAKRPETQPGRRGQRAVDRLEPLVNRGEEAPRADDATAAKRQAPRDTEGNCLGLGPNDRPPDINLMHGWLGVNNAKAVPPPRRTQVVDWSWWAWRLTPYPWRYENASDRCDRRNQPVPLLANVVNLAALLFLIVRFGKQPLREALRKRKRNITSELAKATAIKKSAKERLAHYQDELGHLDDTLAALRQKHAVESADEERRAVAAAEDARQRLLADAELRLIQEAKAARETLSREALEGALLAAEKLLESSVTVADHARLADEYLRGFETALRGETGAATGGGR